MDPMDTENSRTRIGIFSGSSVSGVWTVPPRLSLVAAAGGIELDFREAIWTTDEVVIDTYAVLGGVELKVPAGVEVIDDTLALLGGTEIKRTSDVGAGAKRIRLKGLAMMGGITVKGPKRKKDKKAKK